jgi:hypothetical protein
MEPETHDCFSGEADKDGNLIVYTGAIDNDPEEDKSDRINYLEQALSLQKPERARCGSTKAMVFRKESGLTNIF